MKGDLKKIIMPAVILLIICAISTSVLAATHQVTKPIIEERAIEVANSTRALVLPDGDDFVLNEQTTLVDGVKNVYDAKNGAGIVCTVVGTGYGGDIEMMIGIAADGTIKGVNPISNSETSGLGSNALTPKYLSQFLDAKAITNKSNEEGKKIDAYTGATITSKAVFAIVQTALEQFNVTKGGAAPVALSAEEKLAEALKVVIPGTESFEKIDGDFMNGVIEVHKAANDAGYAIYTKAIGYAGEDNPIKVLVGIDATGVVTGVQFIENKETKGIGSEAFVDSFAEQFVGASAITLEDGEGKKIDVVSGATYSSKGIFECVRIALEQFSKLK